MMMNINIKNIPVYLLLTVMFCLMIASSALNTLTYDETSHLEYGTKLLHLNPDRVRMHDDSKMPFSVFNAVSFHCAKKILEYLPKGCLTDNEEKWSCYCAGRFSTILFSLVLGLYIFKWSRELYGFIPAIFSLFLYVFSPNILAHSQLITTDLYAALMITVSSYYFWKFIEFGGWKRAILSAVVLGLSQHAKYTCIFLYPIFLTIVLIRYSNLISGLVIKKNVQELRNCFKIFLKYFLAFIAISILIINIGYLFNKSFTPLSKYKFNSDLFKTVQTIPILKNIIVPVPYPYLQGLDMVKFHEDTGASFGNIYLLGKIKPKGKHFEGFKSYFFYATLFKEPIATQLFIIISFIAFIWNRKKHYFLKNELYLLFPVLFFTVYFSFFYKAQIGIRFLLPIFPLLYIFCGNLLENWKMFNFKLKSIFIILSIYLVVSNLSYFPHYLSYFNELMWDRKQAYKILADSNIDWGQNESYFNAYMKNHPESKSHPQVPVSGRIVVTVNALVGITASPEQYRWLRENFEPVEHIAYSYLIYEVSPEDLEKVLQKY
jgi:hypothetical protein